MDLIVSGVGLGLLLAILIGPVFFMLIQTSIDYGFKSAIIFSLGVLNADILYILLSYFGLSAFITDNMQLFRIMGGGIFIVFGLVSIFNSGKLPATKSLLVAERSSAVKVYVKGFVINALSPFVPLFWIAAVGSVSSNYYGSMEIMIFFIVVLVTVFITDIVKAKTAHKLSSYLTYRFIRIVKITAGIVFIGAAIRILIS